MSTILSTSNPIVKPYTVIGGDTEAFRESVPPLSVIILGRSGRFHREELLSEIESQPELQAIHIEGPECSYDIEPISRKFPGVKFILLHDNLSAGEKISIGMNESGSSLCLVIWSDMRILHLPLSARLIKKISESGASCTVPVLKNTRSELIPSILAPVFIKRHLHVLPFNPVKDASHSVFPFDYAGVYDKKKYHELCGFDPKISNPYWQKMDFGFRSFMWGERIALSTSLVLQYTSIHDALTPETENATPDESYKFFFLKNMFVHLRNGEGRIGSLKSFYYIARADSGPIKALKEFREAREWVRLHAKRFLRDAKELIRSWEPPE